MIAFEVYLNGKQISVAGVGNLGVLTAGICWVRRDKENPRHQKSGLAEEELTIDVGGLVTPTEEHVHWHEHRKVQIGDEVRIKIIEADIVDQPAIRKRTDPAKDEEARKQYVREMAKQLGWRLQESDMA